MQVEFSADHYKLQSQLYETAEARPSPPTSIPVTAIKEPDALERELALFRAVPRAKVLSFNEEATLHMLFGSQKPEEMTFYGRNKVHQIHKGHLLDVRG